ASPYALDAIACKIINLDINKVPTIRGSIKRDYIKKDLSDVVLVGDDINKFIIKDFKIPKTSKDFRLLASSMPKFIHEPLTKLLTPKPIISYKDCVKCKKCIEICPAQVISLNKKIEIDLNKCIRCFCCHELCPKQAIDIKRSIIFRLIK
ncbi:MAG: 4Fe-4S binding protein, partial [Paeniclostridium sp.]